MAVAVTVAPTRRGSYIAAIWFDVEIVRYRHKHAVAHLSINCLGEVAFAVQVIHPKYLARLQNNTAFTFPRRSHLHLRIQVDDELSARSVMPIERVWPRVRERCCAVSRWITASGRAATIAAAAHGDSQSPGVLRNLMPLAGSMADSAPMLSGFTLLACRNGMWSSEKYECSPSELMALTTQTSPVCAPQTAAHITGQYMRPTSSSRLCSAAIHTPSHTFRGRSRTACATRASGFRHEPSHSCDCCGSRHAKRSPFPGCTKHRFSPRLCRN